MAARQKTLDDMTPDEREAVLAQVQTFKQEHSAAEDPACGILRLRDGANREKAPLFYQVVAANKLLQQDLKWVRAARHDTLVAAIGDSKPLDSRKASLLAIHDVGTGKTVTGIMVLAGVHRIVQLANQPGRASHAKKTMIIVPKSVLHFWHEKVQEWTTLDKRAIVVAEQKYTDDPQNLQSFKNALVVITTPDVLKGAVRSSFKGPPGTMSDEKPLDEVLVRKPRTRLHPLLSLLPTIGRENSTGPSPYALTIVDEVHLHTKPNTWLACAIRLFTKHSVYKLALTGTPVKSSPVELMYLCQILDVRIHEAELQARMFAMQQNRNYFGHFLLANAVMNTKHLAIFRERFVDRVDKAHIVPPLPPKHEWVLYYDPFVGLDNATGTLDADVIARHNATLLATRTVVDADNPDANPDLDPNPEMFPEAPEDTEWRPAQKNVFSTIVELGNYEFSSVLGTHGAAAFNGNSTLYDDAERLPSQAMLLIERVVKDRQAKGHVRIAIFAESVVQLKILRRFLEAKRMGEFFLFDGVLNDTERAEMVKDFLECEKGVIFLSKAGGIGITLCPGCEVMLSVGSLPWNAVDVDQAFGRVHRIGQTQPVELVQLIARRSVTAAKYKLHEDKRGRLAAAVANEDYTNFDNGGSAWKSTGDILSYVAPLDAMTGNYTVMPRFMAEETVVGTPTLAKNCSI